MVISKDDPLVGGEALFERNAYLLEAKSGTSIWLTVSEHLLNPRRFQVLRTTTS